MVRLRSMFAWGASAVGVLGLGAYGLAWWSAPRWAPSMIAKTWSPGEQTLDVPVDVSHRVDVERDGAVIKAWVFDPEEEPRGTVLLLHGIHDSKESLIASARRHVGRGVRAVAIDHRGHGESTGDWLTYGVKESLDTKALVDQLESEELLTRPLSVAGGSFGAATSLQYAAIDDRVQAVVALAAFSSLRDIVPEYVKWTLRSWAWIVPDALLARAVDVAGERADFDPDAACPACAAREIRVPVLLIHSRDDERIPYTHSEEIFSGLPDSAKLHLVDGLSHAEIGSPKHITDEIDSWLEKHATRR